MNVEEKLGTEETQIRASFLETDSSQPNLNALWSAVSASNLCRRAKHTANDKPQIKSTSVNMQQADGKSDNS